MFRPSERALFFLIASLLVPNGSLGLQVVSLLLALAGVAVIARTPVEDF